MLTVRPMYNKKKDNSYLGQAVSSPAPDLVVTLFVFDSVSESETGGWSGVPLQGNDGFHLGSNIPFVPELILPLIIGLFYHHRSEQGHLRIQANPQDRRIANVNRLLNEQCQQCQQKN